MTKTQMNKLLKQKKIWVAAKNLEIGDFLQSKTGRIYKVTKKDVGNIRTIILFDDDMEVDFENYHQLQIIKNENIQL